MQAILFVRFVFGSPNTQHKQRTRAIGDALKQSGPWQMSLQNHSNPKKPIPLLQNFLTGRSTDKQEGTKRSLSLFFLLYLHALSNAARHHVPFYKPTFLFSQTSFESRAPTCSTYLTRATTCSTFSGGDPTLSIWEYLRGDNECSVCVCGTTDTSFFHCFVARYVLADGDKPGAIPPGQVSLWSNSSQQANSKRNGQRG